MKTEKETQLAIANELKKLRMKAGYKSSETFAFDHDLPRVQYWRMEKGTNFTLKSLLKVTKIHKISLADLFKSAGA